jgi:hypothetical protein
MGAHSRLKSKTGSAGARNEREARVLMHFGLDDSVNPITGSAGVPAALSAKRENGWFEAARGGPRTLATRAPR